MELINSLFNEAFFLINSTNAEKTDEDIYSIIQSNLYFNNNKRFIFKANYEDYKKAIVLFEQVLKINPNCKLAYNYSGTAKKNTQDYEGAMLDYSKAIEIDENYALPYINKGNLHYILREYSEAIKEYTKGISIIKNYPLFYELRGRAKRRICDISGAIEDFKEVINLEPDNPIFETSYIYEIEAEMKLRDTKTLSNNLLIIKAISEMNTPLIGKLLDDDETYLKENNEKFLKKIEVLFDKFKVEKNTKLSPYEGGCVSEICHNKGCKGYTFIGDFSKHTMELVFENKSNLYNELCFCYDFKVDDENVSKEQGISIINDVYKNKSQIK